MVFFNKNAIRNKLQHYKKRLSELLKQKEKEEENRKVDEASWESMDASDPPAHISKSPEDKFYH